MKRLEKNFKKIVVKIGASLIFSDKDKLDCSLIGRITRQIFALSCAGKEVVIVSSGAIALGSFKLGMSARPKELSCLQAAAAVGQHELMDVYRRFFKEKGLNCAQVLLTWDDFTDRRRYLNAKNTLFTLLKLGVIPVVNENDTVSTNEIRFGDNDKLSALVSSMINADLLVILSDVDGLLMQDNKTLIRIVDEITPQIQSLASPSEKKTCVGGMLTKIEAAKIAMDSGIPCVIANGRKERMVLSVMRQPGKQGTLFVPKAGLTQRLRWIAFGTKPKGKIIVDAGAKKALENKKSLLSVGVTGAEGTFASADIVSIIDWQGNEFARGKVSLSSSKINEIKGRHFDKEVIHRDNIVILS